MQEQTFEQNNQQNNQQNFVIGVDPGVGKSAAVLAVYDATSQQLVFLSVEEDNEIVEYTQVFQPFLESLSEYDRLREVNLSGEGNEQELETASEIADNYFFEANCIGLEGIEGELPENWKDEIDLVERQAGIRRLLSVKILKDSDAPKIVKKKSFGNGAKPKNRIRLLSIFNGKEVETAIVFADKLPSDISKYNRLKARIGLKEGDGFDDAKIKIPAQMVAKAEIAKNIGKTVDKPAGYVGYTTEGYEKGVVPIHHLALALTAYFEKSIKTNKKK